MRLAVVSPFVDRSHGTERCIAEQLERFAAQPDAEIHLYAQRIEDLSNVVCYPAQSPGSIVWHKVPRLRGPHLFGYVWWFFANHMQRWWDTHVRGLRFDLYYTAGINALDADAISIHVVFHEFYRRVRPGLRLRGIAVPIWLITVHRRLYYLLICFLETVIYPRREIALTAISQHSADSMREFFGRNDVLVIRYGIDTGTFRPEARLDRRETMRSNLRIGSAFCLLLIGNDWKSKGLNTLLRAVAVCADLPFMLLVVGSDDRRAHAETVRTLNVAEKVQFLDPSPDVMQFYAAADAYVGPSLEDAYGLPILEAMACGLPVIASSLAGASEIISDGRDGFVLRDPEDSRELAALLRKIYSDVSLRMKIGEEAARSAAEHTWDRNACAIWEFLNSVLAKKLRS